MCYDSKSSELQRKFQDIAMTVKENHQYSIVDDKAWRRDFPPSRGFVRLGPKGRPFAVAAFHQLHCINALRFDYTVARDGLVSDTDTLRKAIDHGNHCFQFLRQSIQCRADSSVVPLSATNVSVAAAGFGVTHRCRDWVQLKNFVTENWEKWNGVEYLEEEKY